MTRFKSRIGVLELLAVFVIVALLLALLAVSPPAYSADSSLSGGAVSGPNVFATLAPLDSFEFKAAPIYTRIKVVAHEAEVALVAKQISKTRAQRIHDQALTAWTLANAAVDVCAQSNKTGKCTGSTAAADKLLRKAAAALPKTAS